ncbi:hypothetical protein [Aureimonas sp. ME7]|uniref:hypothetical protein n=1 Tax=Aureimonas sp. ME7 TaxID=2744252 RepID=UPI0015F772B2|nr:hypothetical protein [Aureimonas sp. ME7]
MTAASDTNEPHLVTASAKERLRESVEFDANFEIPEPMKRPTPRRASVGGRFEAWIATATMERGPGWP